MTALIPLPLFGPWLCEKLVPLTKMDWDSEGWQWSLPWSPFGNLSKNNGRGGGRWGGGWYLWCCRRSDFFLFCLLLCNSVICLSVHPTSNILIHTSSFIVRLSPGLIQGGKGCWYYCTVVWCLWLWLQTNVMLILRSSLNYCRCGNCSQTIPLFGNHKWTSHERIGIIW